METEITVDLEDLRLVLLYAGEYLVTPDNANSPLVWAIDRLGDKVGAALMRNALQTYRGKFAGKVIGDDLSCYDGPETED